jgi:hypothetical protein
MNDWKLKLKGYCIDKDGNRSDFTEENIQAITWLQEKNNHKLKHTVEEIK